MHFRKRTLSAVLTLAVTASLAVVPALMESTAATAAPRPAARAGVTAECANAQTAWALARSTRAAAHRKLVRARKALRAANRTHQTTAIRKAKRQLRHAKVRYAARLHNERVQAARVGYACSAPNSSARAAGTGMKLDLLAIATGAAGKAMDLGTLTTLLNGLVPGVPDLASKLDAGQLNALLSGFNAGTPSLDSLTVLLGSVFTPDQLTALLAGGSVDPALVQMLLGNIINELSGLSGVPVPAGALDPTALQSVVTTVTGLLGGLLPATTTTTGGTTGGTGTGVVCVVVPLVGTVCT